MMAITKINVFFRTRALDSNRMLPSFLSDRGRETILWTHFYWLWAAFFCVLTNREQRQGGNPVGTESVFFLSLSLSLSLQWPRRRFLDAFSHSTSASLTGLWSSAGVFTRKHRRVNFFFCSMGVFPFRCQKKSRPFLHRACWQNSVKSRITREMY